MKKSLGATTIAHPAPAWVIGTYDREGKANVSTVAWEYRGAKIFHRECTIRKVPERG